MPNADHRRRFLTRALPAAGLGALAAPAAGAAPPPGPAVFDVRDFRAAGDGAKLDTAAVQAAVDACHARGGGTVFFPPGRFLSGTVVLKSNVVLHLSPGAVLLGSPDPADYPAKSFPARDLDIGGFHVWALLYADGATNVGVEGAGTIDGNGKPFPKVRVPDLDVPTAPRPRTVFFKNCKAVTLRDVEVRESGMWAVHLALCDDVRLTGLRVFSSIHLNQDGIVLDSCRGAVVSDCLVRTVDDAIVLKSSFPRRCENVAITNCVLSSRCAGIKFGSQSLGGFRTVTVSNCALSDCRLGGLKFQAVDGGDLEDVSVSDVVMTDVAAPIFLRRGNRGQDYGFKEVERPRPVGRLRNVRVSGVRATVTADPQLRDGHTMSIAGIPGHPVEGVVLDDVRVVFPGGGTPAHARRADVPEREAAYPEHTMFGVLPASGLYVRHAKDVTLRDVRFETAAPDSRPALVCDDVADLDLSGFEGAVTGPEPVVRLRQTRGALVRGCRPAGEVETFVRVEGDRSGAVALLANDLRRAKAPVAKGDGFTGAVAEAGNVTGP